MLTYEEFKNELVEEILEYLPDEYSDCDVTIETVIKNNNSVNEGLMIRHSNINVSPNIYIQQFYDEYVEGEPFEDICKKIANVRVDAEYGRNFEIDKILDFDFVKNAIYPNLINKGRNLDQLEYRPHRDFLDLVIVYYVDVTYLDIGCKEPIIMQLGITDELMDTYGIDEEKLYELSMKNINSAEASCKFLHEISNKVIGTDVVENYDIMYLTNKLNCKGSAMIFNNDIIECASGKLNGDFYILPSSVHEVILVSATSPMPMEVMSKMVKDINRACVGKEEFLSDNVYFYDSKEREFFIMID